VAAATGIRFRRDTGTALLFSIVVANMPDFDFLPGALRNAPGLYHRTVAHTIPAAIVCSLIVALVVTRLRGRFTEIFVLSLLVYCSHLAADMINFGGSNRGVQLLWPFSDAWFSIWTPLASQVHSPLVYSRGQGTRGFFADFAGFEFLRALILQGLLFAPLLLVGWSIRRKTARRTVRRG